MQKANKEVVARASNRFRNTVERVFEADGGFIVKLALHGATSLKHSVERPVLFVFCSTRGINSALHFSGFRLRILYML